jgi:hypothetical protein
VSRGRLPGLTAGCAELTYAQLLQRCSLSVGQYSGNLGQLQHTADA